MQNTSQEILLARGVYATVRAEYKSLLVDFAKTCETLRSRHAYALKAVQEGTLDNGVFQDMREDIAYLESMSSKIAALAKEAAEIKVTAWP